MNEENNLKNELAFSSTIKSNKICIPDLRQEEETIGIGSLINEGFISECLLHLEIWASSLED
jgi:hypothetical protein